MSETTPTDMPDAAPAPPPPPAAPRSWGRIVLAELPYLAMLAAGYGGVAALGVSDAPNLLYWEIMAPVFGALCIAAGWKRAAAAGQRGRLVWTQAAHWAAFLAAMLLLFLPRMRDILPGPAAEIGLMLLLGLGTFVAGVHAGSWRIAAVGAVLGLSVPALALLHATLLVLVGGAVVVLAIGALFLYASARATD